MNNDLNIPKTLEEAIRERDAWYETARSTAEDEESDK